MIRIEAADIVFHRPTRETWWVKEVRGDRLTWCGWPPGDASVADCLLVEKADDADRKQLTELILGWRSE